MTENIFATNDDENLNADEEFGDFELPTLSLANVEEPSEAPRYERIPAKTRLDFEVYSVEFGLSSQKKTPFWKMELVLANEADQDKYGPKKRVFKDVYITDGTMKPFVKPLLKALGIEFDGVLTKKFVARDFPEQAAGRIVSYQVVGYKWKNADTGSYEQSFGRKDERKPVPSDAQLADWGVYMNEQVENALPPKGEEDNDGSLDGLSEFDASNFV